MRTRKRIHLFSAILILLLLFTGCTDTPETNVDSANNEVVESAEIEKNESDEIESVVIEQPKHSLLAQNEQSTYTKFSIDDINEYDGEPYILVNENIPYFVIEDLTTTAYEYYSSLDDLGRCGVTHACVGIEIMPTEERGSIGQVKPSGWHTIKYDCIEDLYLYNRCHLIGYQLTGENANTSNLITGTRYMNMEGMLTFENLVSDYVEESGNHVMYRVTPIFEDENLVATGVLMEAYSVEDEGESICFNVFVYNVQPGVVIDYKTGDSYEYEDENTDAEITTESIIDTSKEYVLNTNTMKIHIPSCSSVDDMKEHNKEIYYGNIEDLLEKGYTGCKRCNP